MKEKLTIGQLAKHANVTVRTLRYYDKINLLNPSDYREGGHRLYSLDDLKRLQQIQALKFLGLSLKEIDDLLKKQSIEKHFLEYSINFKKNELLAEQEEIQRTIEKLNHMNAIINDKEHVDISLFCFVVSSTIWEEMNLDGYNDIENLFYNELTSTKRIEIDKIYFDLYTEIKKLVFDKVCPTSIQAQHFIGRLIENIAKAIPIYQEKSTLTEMKKTNIYNPFTEKEQKFLENAYDFYLSKEQERNKN
ncbi:MULTISPECIES: MerR family transcriptional regulator [Bacillus]|uniref:MerR family transcriptional regulator n=1 Tax=Bacillus TaxID=1386 RepID=UPI000A5F2354|nr:MerR family transcriptional regulator [Bacillus anthracis]WIG19474.1 MerR family transcriptional regulator [Bacillus anthracis]